MQDKSLGQYMKEGRERRERRAKADAEAKARKVIATDSLDRVRGMVDASGVDMVTKYQLTPGVVTVGGILLQ